MAESYSVKATLSAKDQGFTSTMKGAAATTESLGSKIKSGLGFGILTGIGMSAFNALSSGARGLIAEIDQSNAAWKTFEQNMAFLGQTPQQIASVKSALQDYAQQTVYSSSDMASTYAQLEAVGVGAFKSLENGTEGLVKGFGGLAAAAENPQQAMKTLSMQATQMAAKPTVAWADFKLMLEQTPAGIAAVAKEMGMSTSELVSKVQAGEIATEDFFAAIEKAGNSDAFSKMATEAKTVGQAMDGLKETLGNKLGPAFDVLSQKGISTINGIADKIASIDASGLADKVTTALAKAEPYFTMFKNVLLAIGKVLKVVGKFLLNHADAIAKMIPVILGAVAAYKAFKIAKSVAPGIMSVTKSLTSLAGKGIGGLGSKLSDTADGIDKTGKASKRSSKNMLASAKSFALMGVGILLIAAGFTLLALAAIKLADAGGGAIAVMFGLVVALAALGAGMMLMMNTVTASPKKLTKMAVALVALGAAVLMIGVGFALMAQSSIALANAGGAAIAVMAGMVVVLALLAVGAALLGAALTSGALGFIAFGAALLLAGVAAILAATALVIISSVLPVICEYGFRGAGAIALLGASMLAFALGASAAGVACVVLAAGLALIGASVLIVAAGVLALSAAVLLLSAGAIALGAGLMICATAFMMMAAALPICAASSLLLVTSFTLLMALSVAMGAAMMVAVAAVLALSAASLAGAATIAAYGAAMLAACAGVLSMNAALSGVNRKMKSIKNNAKSAASSFKAMSSAAKATKSAISSLASTVQSSMNQVTNAMNSAASKAQSAGRKLGTGFTNGMKSGLAPAPSVARQAVNSIASAFNSGYGRAYSSGRYIGQGLVNGLRSMLGSVRSIAQQIADAVNDAIEAKAKIGSPSKVTKQYGQWIGEGLIIGIDDMVSKAYKAAENLVGIPDMSGLSPAMAFGGELSADYDYYRNAEFVIDVPLTVDGKEFARATASYTEDELNKRQTRNNRKRGKV